MKISQFCIYLPISILFILFAEAAQENAPIIARPGCNHTCGNVIIPFPFGIGANCSLDDSFEINCKPSLNSSTSIKPFLSKFNIEVIEISLTEAQNLKVQIPPMNVCSLIANISLDLRKSPYEFSTEDNVFVVEGCPGSAVLADENSTVLAGCGTICNNSNGDMPTNNCYGVHCCQTPLLSESYGFDDSSLQFYKMEFNPQSSQDCLVASLMDSEYLNKYVAKLSSSLSYAASGVPVVLIWSWTSEIEPDHNSNVDCFRDMNKLLCSCDIGYYGNPYLSNGCQIADLCKNCRGSCYGSWDMMGRRTSTVPFSCTKNSLLHSAILVGVIIGFGIVVLVIGLNGLNRYIRRQREKKQRADFFKRNGGLLLQQQLSSNEGVVERIKIFPISELDKATNHFSKNRILGQGGQGTVYKGMLPDGGIVAVKKSKLVDEDQLEQFINEVVILSQINHRNVVKLLGCCLETEVPLLVYEFIPNGTLSHYIHHPDEEDFVISWEMRLKIASESAAAIAYLHSSSSIPIYHRDIKSANILLDEKHKAKVSDFGSSKTIAIDQTHLTTLVQGTLGYLDPEYFLSYQFTEKSDVYSFGVVLLELLTSKKPIYRDGSSTEQKNLVTEFLVLCESSRLSNILDPEIVREAKEDEMISVVELAKRCVSWSGKMRPTMKEVATTLEMIIKSPDQVSRWYQEQEAFPIQFAGFDGFDMAGISEAEFSTTLRSAGVASPPYTDEHRLLPDTI